MRRGPWLALLLLAAPAWADSGQPSLTAELDCQPEAGSSRLVCNVDYRTAATGRIVWADALVTAAPAFARPLRARVTAGVERGGAAARAGLALVPSGRGNGKLEVRARSVICVAGETSKGTCFPVERELSTVLAVP